MSLPRSSVTRARSPSPVPPQQQIRIAEWEREVEGEGIEGVSFWLNLLDRQKVEKQG